MVHDFLILQRVEKLSTTVDTMTRNIDLKTPKDVFSEENEKLRSEAKNWMCENAKNCSIVAVLIATVAFTSAYTIPGGPNEKGYPVLKNKPLFLLFTLADAISLSSALTSVIMFLNILTSSFQFKDFESSLFEKQLTALILLIISVAMMMVSFSATLILTVNTEAKSPENIRDITLYGVSFFPVFVFLYAYIDILAIIEYLYSAYQKMIENIVATYHKIWDYKPRPLHPVNGFARLATHSPV